MIYQRQTLQNKLVPIFFTHTLNAEGPCKYCLSWHGSFVASIVRWDMDLCWACVSRNALWHSFSRSAALCLGAGILYDAARTSRFIPGSLNCRVRLVGEEEVLLGYKYINNSHMCLVIFNFSLIEKKLQTKTVYFRIEFEKYVIATLKTTRVWSRFMPLELGHSIT